MQYSPALAPTLGVVVGPGRVGRALHRFEPSLPLLGRSDVLAEALQGLPPCPIYVCTTNEALSSVIAQTPASRLQDLVFLQNGMLMPLLSQHGLKRNTRALLYLSAAADGSCTDGKRTVVTGRWADKFVSLLRAGGIQCRIVDEQQYPPLMVEKVLWSSIFWLLSDALGGLPVGEVATQHSDLVEELVQELLPVAMRLAQPPQQHLQVPAAVPGSAPRQPHEQECCAVTEALLDYSLSIPAAVPSREMALAEFEWRNGWFLRENPTPRHEAWLRRAGVPLQLLNLQL